MKRKCGALETKNNNKIVTKEQEKNKNKKRRLDVAIKLPTDIMEHILSYNNSKDYLNLRACSVAFKNYLNKRITEINFKSTKENLSLLLKSFKYLESIHMNDLNFDIDSKFHSENRSNLSKLKQISQFGLTKEDFEYFANEKIYIEIRYYRKYIDIIIEYKNILLLTNNGQIDERKNLIKKLKYINSNTFNEYVLATIEKKDKEPNHKKFLHYIIALAIMKEDFKKSQKLDELFTKMLNDGKIYELETIVSLGYKPETKIEFFGLFFLIQYLHNGDMDLARFLVKNGLDVGELHNNDVFVQYFYSILKEKKVEYHVKYEFLLDNNFDVGYLVSVKKTPVDIFFQLLQQGDYEHADFLLEGKFKMITQNKYFYQKLAEELFNNDEKLSDYLFTSKELKLQSNINTKPFIDMFALFVQSFSGKAINILKKYGFDVKKHINSIELIDVFEFWMPNKNNIYNCVVTNELAIEFMIQNGFEYKNLSDSYFMNNLLNEFKLINCEKGLNFIENLNKNFLN